MRCSSCEPLLDAYLEASLPPRQGGAVARHLRGCGRCAALLRELRVIDALLETARPPGSVGADFTASVVTAARLAPPRARRRISFGLVLLAYLAIAWALVLVGLRSRGFTAAAGTLALSERHGFAALAAAAHALAPATPLAAALMTGVLLLDVLLLCAVAYGYRHVRPLMALYLTRGSRS
ncbi:MAG TPA: zf-HC2 domain-containing protein [Candidatus Binatia bacterium]|nr:zf-HC2 domain-containing protein [Candidatus Binatia bacterium]